MPLSDVQRAYLSSILHLLGRIKAQVDSKWSRLVILSHSRHDAIRTDDWTDDVNGIFKELNDSVEQAKKIAPDLALNNFQGVNTRNRRNFLRTMHAALGVNVFDNLDTSKQAKLFVHRNTQLITSIPKKYLDQVQDIVLHNFQRGRRAEDFQDEVEERFGVAESRAALIARDQVSKLNGALTQERQESIGIDGYFWRTSEDERVRPTHVAHDGKRFQWEDPPPDTGHPGEDINCRCHADPDISSIFGDN
jgi:SPP1 gp7 family putative phage head morphogenesis protein